jgi:hypothetical protein
MFAESAGAGWESSSGSGFGWAAIASIMLVKKGSTSLVFAGWAAAGFSALVEGASVLAALLDSLHSSAGVSSALAISAVRESVFDVAKDWARKLTGGLAAMGTGALTNIGSAPASLASATSVAVDCGGDDEAAGRVMTDLSVVAMGAWELLE